MSLEAMVWALKQAPVTDAQEHLVLIGLADHAAADGSGAWPSKATLAEYARCSTRTVHNKLRRLEAAGIIARGDQQLVAHIRGDRRPVVYDLDIHGRNQVHPVDAGNEVPPVPDGVNEDAGRGEQPSSHGVNAVADKPSLNRTEPNDATRRADAADGSAQDLVGEWVDHCPQRPPGRVVGQVAKEVGIMLAEGIPYATVRNGLAQWHRKGLHPSALASVVHEVMNPPTREGTTSTRVNQAMEVARRMAAADGHAVPMLGDGR